MRCNDRRALFDQFDAVEIAVNHAERVVGKLSLVHQISHQA